MFDVPEYTEYEIIGIGKTLEQLNNLVAKFHSIAKKYWTAYYLILSEKYISKTYNNKKHITIKYES